MRDHRYCPRAIGRSTGWPEKTQVVLGTKTAKQEKQEEKGSDAHVVVKCTRTVPSNNHRANVRTRRIEPHFGVHALITTLENGDENDTPVTC